MKEWLMASRPKTLPAALVPVLVGTSFVLFNGYTVKWIWTLLCIIVALSLQIATNLFNDALDFKKGADSISRIGPTRVTQSGLLSYGQVMAVGVLFLIVALFAGIPLVLRGGSPFLFLGILSIFLGYGYTGGPYPLAYKGLGDVFVFFFFGLVAVGGVYYLQTLEWRSSVLLVGSQVGLTATVLITINNLRDRVEDKKIGKNTLAVKIGEKASKAQIALLYFFALLFQLYWFSPLDWHFFLLLIPGLGFLILTLKIFQTPPGILYNRYLAFAGFLHLLFGIFLSLSFLLD